MSRRTQLFQQIPWSGGVNTSVEAGVLPQNDLTICDNVTLLSTGVKRKREGRSYWDALSDVPAVVSRASSGTTRTLTFASDLEPSGIDKLAVGESITITSTNGTESSNYGGTVIITAITTTSLTYTKAGSLTESTTATATLTVARTFPIVHITDYWRESAGSQVQQVIASTSQPLLYYYDDSGRRQLCTGSITARVAASPRVNSVIFNNQVIVFHEGAGNVPIKWNGSALSDLAASCPDASIGAVWLSRVWTNDKTDVHRVHYSATGTLDTWLGASDSGALDIRIGDGDPEGITAIYPYKGDLFVAKRNRLYRIVGDSPENFRVLDVSAGLGIEAQATVCPVDQQDLLYASNKGFHTLTTTSSYGDFVGSFLSKKIQPSFNDWEVVRAKYIQSVYIPILNSVAFTVAENNTNRQDTIWLYNMQIQEWYRWPEVDAQALGVALLGSTPTLLIGTSAGKIIKANNGTRIDYGTTAIRYRIKSGTIYPDNNPITLKAFKRLTLLFKPKTSYSFTARVKIDGFAEQILGFSDTAEGERLGIDFVLGESILGTSRPFTPHTVAFDGYGHGISVEVEQSGTGDDVDIYGFAIEYEIADFSQEGGSTNESGD